MSADSDDGTTEKYVPSPKEKRWCFLRLVAATAQRLPAGLSAECLEINGAPAALLPAESRLWGGSLSP